MMGAFYFALVDENGVLCVDQLDDNQVWTEEKVASHAEQYPSVIYFWFWSGA